MALFTTETKEENQYIDEVYLKELFHLLKSLQEEEDKKIMTSF